MFRSFKSRDFGLFFIGQFFYSIGNMIQFIALPWLVYDLNNSAVDVGLMFFAGQFAMFILSPISGVLSDGFSRYKILLFCNVGSLLITIALGVLIFTGSVSLLYVIIYKVIDGLLSGLEKPIKKVFIQNVILEKDHLVNAISLNATLFNGAKIVGPLIAGLLIPLIGIAPCIFLNSFALSVMVVCILLMDRKRYNFKRTQVLDFKKNLYEGFSYSFGNQSVKIIILLTAAIGFIAFHVNILLPVYAKVILNGGVDTLGFLTTSLGVGAFSGAIFLTSQNESNNLVRIIMYSLLFYSIGFTLLSFSQLIQISVLSLFILGFGQALFLAASNSLIQSVSNKNITGRVISFYIMFFMGAKTIGSLLIGNLTELFGVNIVMQIIGVGCLLLLAFYKIISSKHEMVYDKDEELLNNNIIHQKNSKSEIVFIDQ